VVLAVLDTIVDQVVPPSADLSILYPIIAEPPVFAGAVQERLICDEETAVAVSPVGDCDVVAVAVSRAPTSLLKYDGTVSYGFDKTSFVIYR